MVQSHSITVLKTLVFLCFFCTHITSDSSRDEYNNRLQHSESFTCSQTTNSTTSFRNNLNLLLSDFTLKSSLNGFYNTSIGNTLDTVYGYYMCRADITQQLCNSCILNGTQFATESSCEYKDGVYFSEKCIFVYSNHSIYGLLEQNSVVAFDYVKTNVSNPQQFSKTLSSTIKAVIKEASSDTNKSTGSVSVPGFATKEENVTLDETIYSMAQCTPDILGANCSKCLTKAFSSLQGWANGSPGAIAFLAKCQLRYDNTSFYDVEWFRSSNGVKGLRPNLAAVYAILLLFIYFKYGVLY